MHNFQNCFFGLQGIASQLSASMTPTVTPYHQALVASVTARSLAVDAARLAISSKVSPTGLGLTLGTIHHGLKIGSFVSPMLPIDIGRSMLGTKWPAANLGLTFATAGLGLSVGQLLKGVETTGLASLALQVNPQMSGWILDEIADSMAEERKMYDNINSLGKRQKLNRRDFNDLLPSDGKGRKKLGSNDGLDQYILHDN